PSTNAVPDLGNDKFFSVFLAPDTLKGGHQTAHGRHIENCCFRLSDSRGDGSEETLTNLTKKVV
ncbi:MAG: hypothetical protein NT154_29315, partial [Verrucomicrobia bacterium]|nr:hypothetical protein [Verrucomicrobiota bacterium]